MCKERKIREALKSVYDLYSEVDDFIFTTYNYEPDFFDEHIVAYLMGFDRKICTIGELKDADEWIRKNHVTVYYDKNAVSPGSSCLTIPVFPQNIATGVFHPKVIVIYGRRKDRGKESAHLFVSSCNLTVSGYGRNKEGFACVEVKSKQVAESLSCFIDSLYKNDDARHLGLKDFLMKIQSQNADVEFLWTNPGYDKGIKLYNYLRNLRLGDLTIVSPYFDEKGPKELLDGLSNRKRTVIVPAIDGDTYNIHKSDYEMLRDENITFSELDDAESRFVHAKMIQFGEKLIVGSYNFTTAAMKGQNAEAALVFRNVSGFKLNRKDVSDGKFLPDEESVSNRDENAVNDKCLFVSVSVYWKEFKIQISSTGLKRSKTYLFRIDGLENWTLRDEQKIEITTEIANHLLKHKSFSVFCDGKICFKGLINEYDAGEYRPELCCESLNESIREWFTYSNDEKNNRKPDLRLINPDDEDTENALGTASKDTSDVFDNYYLVSKSFENLLSQIQMAKDVSREMAPTKQRKTKNYWQWVRRKQIADQNLFGFLVTKPGSIQNIVNFLQKKNSEKKNDDIVYDWLVASYVDSAISLLPKKKVLMLNNEGEFDNGKNPYKIKLDTISKQLDKIRKRINKSIKKKVDGKYFNWVVSEFNKRICNV